MQELAETWRRHYMTTLLGRLRLGMFAEITGSEKASPDAPEVRLFLMSKRRIRRHLGQIYSALFHLRATKQSSWNELDTPTDFRWVLHKLERQPYREAIFVELTECPAPWPETLGVLIRCEPLAKGGYVYSLLYLDEEFSRRNVTLGYAEIRARKQDPGVHVSVLSSKGYVNHTDFAANPHAELAVRLLGFAAENRMFRTITEVVASGTAVSGMFDGAEDPVFLNLAQNVFSGEIRCAELTVPLDRVKPHDAAFALNYPSELVEPVLAEIRAGNRMAMAVYWRDDRFIMCDDYPVYMAYRERGEKHVPVVVLGDYPAEFGQATRTGGPELLPDLMIGHDPRALDEQTMELMLDARLEQKRGPRGPLELYTLHDHLCGLLEDSGITERRIHDFLAKFPVVLDAYGASVRSELRLGNRYRVDLVLQYPTADRRILLVELEAPSKQLFTRAGRPQAPITHALQQVEDWLRWWIENPSEIPEGIERGVQPDGLVVAGRSRNLTNDHKMRLVHLNQNRKVKLITYDDLLDRLEEMIRNLELT